MLSVLRLGFAALCLLGLLPVSAVAQTDAAPATQNHEQAMTTAPGKFIQDLGDQAISVIANKDLSQDQRSDHFRQMLRSSFDLATIGRFVIGRSWNAATSDQQQEYMHLFEALVIKTYSDRFAIYTGEGFRVTGVRPESEKDTVITSEITHPDGSEPTEVDWRVRHKDGKLGIIDVVIEGVSLSVTQRQEYASIIQRDGGKLNGLLALMRQQLQEPVSAQGNQPG
jgi:phospholipid transport system substrate-binding protein